MLFLGNILITRTQWIHVLDIYTYSDAKTKYIKINHLNSLKAEKNNINKINKTLVNRATSSIPKNT